ncbi:MAG: hypothetical protein JXB26_04765 [Candidatus Aminicenantes bacterium]|nr:hypothetical protein [Candidatus Aminicenantes bacterium]
MSGTLVAYFSLTGNTRKVAEAIYDTLDEPKVIKKIQEVKEAVDFSLIFIGFPVHSHSTPYKVEEFIRSLPSGIKIALFSTHGSLTGSRLSREAMEHAVSLATKTKVLSTFSCRGEVSLEGMDVLSKSPEHQAWTEMAPSARSHPDEHDLHDAQSFAKWTVVLASQP